MSLLSKQEKKIIIQKLKNFPTVPLRKPQGTKDNLLFEYYPWGCQNIREKENPYNPERDFIEGVIIDNFINVILGAKYGIISMQMEKYLDLYKKFLRLKSDERLFLKLYCPEYKFLTLNAIGKVVEFYPEKTFRFWKHTIKNKNYYGVIKVEYSALGQVNFNQEQVTREMNENIFYNLKKSYIPWNNLVLADQYEWQKRRQYISMMGEEGEVQKFDKKEKEKNQELLEKVQAFNFINEQE